MFKIKYKNKNYYLNKIIQFKTNLFELQHQRYVGAVKLRVSIS